MGAVLAFTQTQVTECCFKCGITFSMPQSFREERLRDHAVFFCPNGHGQCFNGETPEAALRRELEAKERQLAMARAEQDRLRDARDRADRQAAAARGQITKIKNRVGCGVCPLCSRNFTALRRHMETKHPDYRHAVDEKKS